MSWLRKFAKVVSPSTRMIEIILFRDEGSSPFLRWFDRLPEQASGSAVVVVSHGFIKHGAAVPRQEIERALKRRALFEARPERHTYKRFFND